MARTMRTCTLVVGFLWCALVPFAPAFGGEVSEFLTLTVTSVSPNQGSIMGGARVFLNGSGFETNHFVGGNMVQIGRDGVGWAECDVIEAACSVDCGSSSRVVCDLKPFIWEEEDAVPAPQDTRGGRAMADAARSTPFLDILVETKYGKMRSTLGNAFQFLPAVGHTSAPKLRGVWPRSFTAEHVLNITGTGLPTDIKDYRVAFVGNGPPIMGGNVGVGRTTVQAQCRPQNLNRAVAPGFPDTEHTTPVSQEDADPLPISDLLFRCVVNDFEAGSYNFSAMLPEGVAWANPAAAAASLFSRDAFGALHEIQYVGHSD